MGAGEWSVVPRTAARIKKNTRIPRGTRVSWRARERSPRFLPARFAALTATAATGAEAATTATAARRHRPRLVDRQAAAAVLVLVQFVDGALRAFRIAHLDEGEAACLAGGAVANEIDGA